MNEAIYTNSLLTALKTAQSMAIQDNHATFGVAHLVLAMLMEGTGLRDILDSMQKDVGYIQEWFETHREMYSSSALKSDCTEPDADLKRVLDEAERSKIKLGTDRIDAVCVFTAVSREGVIYSRQQLETLGVMEDDILSFYNASESVQSYQGEEMSIIASFPYAYVLKNESTISKGKNIVGREKVVRSILESLERSEHKGIAISGESGVGKTSLIEAFVANICLNKDDMLRQMPLIGVDSAKLLASVSTANEIANKLGALLTKLEHLDNPVLIIDDFNILLDSGGNSDKSDIILNILGAQISNGSTTIIFVLTNDSYRKHIDKHSIEGKLDVVKLDSLSGTPLRNSLEVHKKRIEAHYELQLSDEAIDSAILLSRRYFKEISLPTGAIDLLDRTAAAVRLANKNAHSELETIRTEFEDLYADALKLSDSRLKAFWQTIHDRIGVTLLSRLVRQYIWNDDDDKELHIKEVRSLISDLESIAHVPLDLIGAQEIDAVVSEITGIPIGKIQANEKDRLLGIEDKLQERVKGQNQAISTLSDAIIESRSGLSDEKKPIGSFFFLGPTGTGKTELTKSLAELLFDDESAMIRFDMSEFKEEHSAALLYGAPPGYVGYEEGGLLVTQIRQKPYSVVLFDEIEKAHSSVYDIFLQMMDEGKIHDKLGREGDFSNAIIIFTSNIGSQWIAEQIQAGEMPNSGKLTEVMAQYFRPEFLGRLTEVVPFAPITREIAKQIFELHFSRLKESLLKQKNISINLDERALDYLVGKGYSPKYGARPIAGVIRTYLKKTISRLIVSESIKAGDNVMVKLVDDELRWEQI